MREVPAFGDHLGADYQVDLAGFDGGDGAGGVSRCADDVAGHDEAAGLGELGFGFLGDALDAGADGDEAVLGFAGGAEAGARGGVAAMVADERAAVAVLDQPGGAVFALASITAMPAEGERRVAAAVHEQHGLLAAFQRGVDGVDDGLREELAAFGRGGAHVDEAEGGHGGGAEAVGEFELAVAAPFDVGGGLERGGGAGQDDGGAGIAGAHYSGIAGVVDHAFFLFEGRIVFFVDHDQAEVGEGQEEGGAGADQDLDLAAQQGVPTVAAPGGG